MRDYSNFGLRMQILEEIRGEENKARKRESLRRFEIYKGRLEEYVVDVMTKDTDPKDIENMRVVSTINLAQRITDKKASVYLKNPEREYSDLSDEQLDRVKDIYRDGKFNSMLKKTNMIYELEDQCIAQVYPKMGKLTLKPMMPHHCDVVPKKDNPEYMEAVVLTAYDKDDLFNKISSQGRQPSSAGVDDFNKRDNLDQIIADPDDYKFGANIAVWWTDTHHFVTDKDGNLLDRVTFEPVNDAEFDRYTNPIECLPFIDIAKDKDFEFWNRYANLNVDATLQFNVMLSDAAEHIRMQGYSQPIISSLKPPESVVVGPRKAIYLPKVKNEPSEMQPTFEFASPSPDIDGTMNFLEKFLNMLLSAQGMDTGTVTSQSGANRYSSGVDRALAMIEQLEASEDDIDLFQWVERQIFELVKKWLRVADASLDLELNDSYRGALPDISGVSVMHKGPEVRPSQDQIEASVEKRLNMGLMSKAEAIMELRGVDIEEAREIVADIDADRFANMPQFELPQPEEDQEDDGSE